MKLTLLRMVRARRGLTQRELGHAVGMTEVQIDRIERGEVEPWPTTIRELATALGVEVHALVTPDEMTDPMG